MARFTPVTAWALTAALAAGCGASESKTDTTPAPSPSAEGGSSEPTVVETTLAEVGLDASSLDRSADPCEDFFQYACGGWLADAEIPSDRSRFGNFHKIRDRVQETLKTILESARDAKSPTGITAEIGDYYGACTDEDAIAERGTRAIQPLLARARKVKSTGDVAKLVTDLHRRQIWPLFSIAPESDFEDSTKMIAFVDQDGLGLPDRDYYVKDDDQSEKIRETYTDHVATMFELLGRSKKRARRAAAHVMAIETELAKVSKTREERRDLEALYNKVDRDGLEKLAPAFPWTAYFEGLEHPDIREISVTAPKFFERMNALLTEVPAKKWRSYLAWHVVHAMAHALPEPFVNADFELNAALSGQEEIRPRWKRCVDAVDGALGEALAQPFVDEMFPGESKRAAEEMVGGITSAFRELVGEIDWMSAPTKKRALEKLEAMSYLIGYPDEWDRYDFEIGETTFAANELRARAFELQRDLGKIGEPVDRSDWHMTPQTVNAYYTPVFNQMVFPAGILQPPFFDTDYRTAVNLGAIGMVIGHELTHGFDDNGATFDARGNMENWWQEQDKTQFEDRGQCVVDQYAGYQPLPDVSLNGKLTLGENIADMGGVKLAFRAYRKLRADADEAYVADGFTEDQQFFLAVGRAWCTKSRDKDIRRRVVTDPHSPARYRVNGSLSNLPAFAEAFECAEGTPMNPENACEVW